MASHMMMMIVAQKPTSTVLSACLRSQHPMGNLSLSQRIICSRSLTTFHGDHLRTSKTLRNPFVVSANTVPAGPPVLPSGPPSSSGSMSWILGFVVSFILPFFTNKWGPLWVVKKRIEGVVQTAEDIVEGVEKFAERVDKVAEDIAHDLPQGKLRDLVEFIEHTAEQTAKTADCIDNVIDRVQEAEDQVEDMVESMIKPVQNAPPKSENE